MSSLPGHRPPNWSFLENKAIELGFVAVGVSSAKPIPQEHTERFLAWLNEGNHATMAYLERNQEQRSDVGHPGMLPGATMLVSAALPYGAGKARGGLWPKIVAHARGRDYHLTMVEKLSALRDAIEEQFEVEASRVFVDSAPVMERTWAVLCGLGSIGRHGGLIVPGIGTRVVIGEIALSGPSLEDTGFIPTQALDACAGCNLCVKMCPTEALKGDGSLDANRCLSYHTCENREKELPGDTSSKVKTLFGCDYCTEFCPHNNHKLPSELEPIESPLEQMTSLNELLALSQNGLARALKNTTLARTGPTVIKRNARYILARTPGSSTSQRNEPPRNRPPE